MQLIFLLMLLPSLAFGAVTVTVNGSNHTIPQTNERGWGNAVTAWIQAISSNTLQPTGGSFTLSANADFGATYGLKSAFFSTRSANPSTAGLLRLSVGDSIGWRNNANGANLLLAVDGSNRLTFDGVVIPTASSSSTLTGKTIDGDDNTLSDISIASLKSVSSDASKALVRNASGDVTSALIVNANIDASAAIAHSKMAALTASRALVSDGSGLTSVSSVTSTELGYVSGVTSAIQTQLDAKTTALSAHEADTTSIHGISNTADILLKNLSGVTGTLGIANGGTGQTTANAALNALLPTQATHGTKFLQTDGTNTSWASVAGSAVAVTSKSAAYTLTSSDDIVLVNTSGGAFTLTLPAAASNTGKVFTIKKTTNDFTACTLDGNASETIDGDTTTTINTQFEALRIVSDGSNWQILERSIPSTWISYTPSSNGLGTIASVEMFYKRVGDSIIINGSVTAGTVTAAEARIGLPSGLTTDGVSKISSRRLAGTWARSSSGAEYDGLLIEPSVTFLTFGKQSAGSSIISSPILGTNMVGTGEKFSIASAPIPIAGWK